MQKKLIDRIYDTLADEGEFREADEMIGRFAASLDPSRAYSTREFLHLLGNRSHNARVPALDMTNPQFR